MCRDNGKQAYLELMIELRLSSLELRLLLISVFVIMMKILSRGSSKYRGVALHKFGRWEARMGQLLGKEYITVAYLIARLKMQGHYVLNRQALFNLRLKLEDPMNHGIPL